MRSALDIARIRSRVMSAVSTVRLCSTRSFGFPWARGEQRLHRPPVVQACDPHHQDRPLLPRPWAPRRIDGWDSEALELSEGVPGVRCGGPPRHLAELAVAQRSRQPCAFAKRGRSVVGRWSRFSDRTRCAHSGDLDVSAPAFETYGSRSPPGRRGPDPDEELGRRGVGRNQVCDARARIRGSSRDCA